MSPNGRRAWRRAAKKLRRKMGRRWRSQAEWLFGKRWSEIVPNLEAHRNHITGAWFKRHGHTEQGLRTLDSQHPVRVYIGLWGTADGDGVEYAVRPKPFTARSLVGMPMGARKRLYQRIVDAFPTEGDAFLIDTEGKGVPIGWLLSRRLRPCPGCWNCQTTWQQSSIYSQTAVMHRHGCSHDDPSGLCCFGETVPVKMACDGSGVLPARKQK